MFCDLQSYGSRLELLCIFRASSSTMPVSVANMGIVKAWFGSSKDFTAVALKPGVGAPSDDPAVLTKWLVPDSGRRLSAATI